MRDEGLQKLSLEIGAAIKLRVLLPCVTSAIETIITSTDHGEKIQLNHFHYHFSLFLCNMSFHLPTAILWTPHLTWSL